MVGVNTEGTGTRAFAGAAYQSAGKTGTSQVYSLRGGKYNAASTRREAETATETAKEASGKLESQEGESGAGAGRSS